MVTTVESKSLSVPVHQKVGRKEADGIGAVMRNSNRYRAPPCLKVKAGLWNVRGCSKIEKLQQIVDELKERRIQFAVLTETHRETDVILVNGHATLYNSGPSPNEKNIGGVGLLLMSRDLEVIYFDAVSNRIAYFEISIHGQTVGIIAAYSPTECSKDDEAKDRFYEALQAEVQKRSAKSRSLMIMGDFNCRIGKASRDLYPKVLGPYLAHEGSTSENGERLLDLCQTVGMRVENSFYRKPLNRMFTWYHAPTMKGAVLDYVLTQRKGTIKTQDLRASRGADANSDHCLVTTILKLETPLPVRKCNAKRHSRAQWQNRETTYHISTHTETFKEKLRMHISQGSSYIQLVDGLQAAAREMAQKPNGNKPWWDVADPDLKDAINAKKIARKKWLQSKQLEDHEAWKRATKLVKELVKQAKERYVEQTCERAQSNFDRNEMHAAFSELKEAKRAIIGRPKMAANDCLIPKAELIEHYKELFKARETNIVRLTGEQRERDRELEPEDIARALQTMKPHKAPGLSGIRAELLKAGGEVLAIPLLRLFNECWSGHTPLPRDWTDAEVVSIYKHKGARKDPNNYRSIFLLDTIGKLYASVVCEKIKRATNALLSETQFGFRPKRSTEQAILCLRSIIQKSKDSGNPLVIVFVDLKKAFDTIPHEAIINALRKRNCSEQLQNSIEQLMNSPTGYLRGGGSFSMSRGVRQGSKEGPILFNLVFDDILRESIDPLACGITLKNECEWTVKHIEYADDLCLLCKSTAEAEMMLHALIQTLERHKMSLSTEKTKWMEISPLSDTNGSKIVVNGQEIEKVQNFEYLGSLLDASGDTLCTVRNNVSKARRALTSLRPLLRTNGIRVKTKAQLVQCFILPILLYGLNTIVLTANASDRLESLMNTARRMIIGCNSRRDIKVEELRKKVKLPSPAALLQTRRLNLYASIMEQDDDRNIAGTIVHCHMPKGGKSKRAHTKDWMRQLSLDVRMRIGDSNWINQPKKMKYKPCSENSRPALLGERARLIRCTVENCEQMFAENKERNRHIRTVHTVHNRAGTNEAGTHQCPVPNCNKVYKIMGWRDRHLKQCHPNYLSGRETHRPDSTKLGARERRYKCPIPGCDKELPT